VTELSPDLKKLMNVAHHAMSPSAQQVSAVRSALEARLGETPGPLGGGGGAGSGVAPSALATWSALQIIGLSCVMLGVVAGAVELWGHSGSSALSRVDAPQLPEQARAVATGTPPSAASEAAPLAGDVPHEAPRAVVAERAPRKGKAQRTKAKRPENTNTNTDVVATREGAKATTSIAASTSATAQPTEALAEDKDKTLTSNLRPSEVPTKPATDLLAQEVDLLARARAALTHGKPAEALALAEQHAARFPRGTLRQEQLATRMRALCALGRSGDARSALHELESSSRRSPHLMSIDARCLKEAASREAP
jgi:hypothetical protein